MRVIEAGNAINRHPDREPWFADPPAAAGAGVEVVAADVDSRVAALRCLDDPQQQARAVTVLLSQARTGLLAAVAAQDLPRIVEFKAKTAAIQEIAKQLRLGKEMQLDAAEFCRRAERGLGVAIREGQAHGTVETKSEASARGAAIRDGVVAYDNVKPKPTDFAGVHELSNTQGGIYHLTDGISDEQFDDVIAEAKAEGNLSRANVARKCTDRAKPPVPEREPEHPQPIPALGARGSGGPKGDPNEMLGNIDGMLRGIVATLEFIRPQDIRDGERKPLTDGISRSLAMIRKHVKEIANG
ncbi:hypothetical protein [Nocardia terpenica]|uniref:hypothetical protein n=1 Tax=Nocardia terpenica TaxID=455432 RepID=UPI002FE1B7BF